MTVIEPWALPELPYDASLSEDENFLSWTQALARWSVSRKGHMGAIIVRLPQDAAGAPSDASPSTSKLAAADADATAPRKSVASTAT